MRKKCADAGLLQTSLGSVCEFHSPDPAVVRKNVEDCREWVLLAKDIGARGVKVRPNGLPKDVPEEKTLEQIGRALAECGAFAKDHGVEIWVEVHGDQTKVPARMRRIMDVCSTPSVGLTWNSNDTDVADGSVAASFALLRPFIRCCHITDLQNAYPWRELFSLLETVGLRGLHAVRVPAAGGRNRGCGLAALLPGALGGAEAGLRDRARLGLVCPLTGSAAEGPSATLSWIGPRLTPSF